MGCRTCTQYSNKLNYCKYINDYLSMYDDLDSGCEHYEYLKEPTAQEMFEQLGYTKYEDEFELIFSKEFYYHYKNKLERKIISFMKSDKRIDLSIFTDFMTMEEIKAINQQCKEMGWL